MTPHFRHALPLAVLTLGLLQIAGCATWSRGARATTPEQQVRLLVSGREITFVPPRVATAGKYPILRFDYASEAPVERGTWRGWPYGQGLAVLSYIPHISGPISRNLSRVIAVS
jgi:hypothetical protein